jgi:hypothetical protein
MVPASMVEKWVWSAKVRSAERRDREGIRTVTRTGDSADCWAAMGTTWAQSKKSIATLEQRFVIEQAACTADPRFAAGALVLLILRHFLYWVEGLG